MGCCDWLSVVIGLVVVAGFVWVLRGENAEPK
jgi:hypothetical protein